MQISHFFSPANDKEAKLYTLCGEGGMIAQISDFGGDIVSIFVPDRYGRLTDVALGHSQPENYDGGPYFGAMVGRVANRIGKASFMLNGKEIRITANERGNTLHGGESYAFRVWDAVPVGENRLELSLFSPDGDAGFPGNLKIRVIYEILPDNTLSIDMTAETDADTIVNLTNHCYFNLSGENAGPINDHEVAVYADAYQEVDEELIPTGKLIDVTGTGFDLRHFVRFSDTQKLVPGGFDHSFIMNTPAGTMRKMASARSLTTGIRLDVSGTDRAVQFYSGSMLNEETMGKNQYLHPNFSGFCFETQNYVDAINHPEFPSPILKSGETYHQVIHYSFSVEK